MKHHAKIDMRVMTAVLVLGFTLELVLAFPQTQTEMTNQACEKFKKADAELNRVYRQILSAHSGDTNFSTAFRDAQRTWLLFRDAHLKSIFPDPDPSAYGSVNPMCRCGILEEITQERSRQLSQRWIEGFAEGDVCTGTGAVKRSQESGPATKNLPPKTH